MGCFQMLRSCSLCPVDVGAYCVRPQDNRYRWLQKGALGAPLFTKNRTGMLYRRVHLRESEICLGFQTRYLFFKLLYLRL